jgi:hypothetical protein
MCPLCLATTALIVTGSTSAGGLTAYVAKKLHTRRRAKAPSRISDGKASVPVSDQPEPNAR